MITNTLQHRSNYSVDMSVHSDRFIVMSDPTALGPDRGIGHLPSAKVVNLYQKPTWLFANRSRGLEFQMIIIPSISCNFKWNRISLYP